MRGDRPHNPASKKRSEWRIAIGVIIVVVALFGGIGGAALHQFNTNPEFCGLCHIMQPNVDSYLTSNHLDNIHAQAGVQCKECHTVTVAEEIRFGIDFLTGNYTVKEDGTLLKREFKDDMCFQCHISPEYVAGATDFLGRWNPHENSMGDFECSTCHVSHGAQINYCAECHADANTGQRMIEDRSTPHVER